MPRKRNETYLLDRVLIDQGATRERNYVHMDFIKFGYCILQKQLFLALHQLHKKLSVPVLDMPIFSIWTW